MQNPQIVGRLTDHPWWKSVLFIYLFLWYVFLLYAPKPFMPKRAQIDVTRPNSKWSRFPVNHYFTKVKQGKYMWNIL